MAGSPTPHRQVKIFNYIFRATLTAVFLYAGGLKLLDPHTFYSDILSYALFPKPLAAIITYWLPPIEILCAVGLWIPRYRVASDWLIWLMLIAFTILIAVSWIRGIDITCGCFGKTDNETNYPWLIIRDLILLTISSLSLIFDYRFNSLKPKS